MFGKLINQAVIFFVVIAVIAGDMYVNMMSFKCSTSNKTIRSDLKCWTKSFSRKFSTVNFESFSFRSAVETKVRINKYIYSNVF